MRRSGQGTCRGGCISGWFGRHGGTTSPRRVGRGSSLASCLAGMEVQVRGGVCAGSRLRYGQRTVFACVDPAPEQPLRREDIAITRARTDRRRT